MGNFTNIIIKRQAFWYIYVIVLFFVFIPILILGIIHYDSSTSKLKDEYNKNNLNLLEQAKTAVDIVINTTFYTTNQIYEDSQFISLIRKKDEMSKGDKVNVLNRLMQIKDSSKYIDSVAMYLQDGNMMFCTDYGFSSLEDYPDSDVVIKNLEMGSDVRLINSRIKYKSISKQESSAKKVITLLKTVHFTSSKYAVLIVNFDINEIYNTIIKRLNQDNETEVFTIGKDGTRIFSNEQSQLIPVVLQSSQYNDLINLNKKVLEITINRKNYLMASVFSDDLKAYFVRVSSYEQLNKTFASIRNVSIQNSITILIILLFIAMFITQRMAKPVDELLNTASIQKPNLKNGKNIFGLINYFVKETINNNSLLQEKVNRMIPVYKEKLLFSLLVKNDLSRDEIYRRLGEYDIEFNKKYFYVIAIDILKLYELPNKNINLSVLKFTTEELISKVLKENNLTAFKVNVDDKRLALIINMDNENCIENKAYIRSILKKICNLVTGDLGIELAFGVSEGSESIEDLSSLYYDSMKALKYRILGDSNSIVLIGDIIPVKKDINNNTPNIEDKMEGFLLTGDEKQAQKLISEVLFKHSNRKNMTVMDFQLVIMHFAALLSHIAGNLDYDVYNKIVEDKNLFEILGELKTFEDAENFFKTLISKMFVDAKVEKLNSESYYYNRITNYLDEHYNEDISVDILSENINISTSYIFKILRERQKDSFTEYITKKRIEKACELLKTNLKIQEIAEQTGYSCANYFIQVFKKHKGCTPNEYKKIYTIK